MQIEIDEVALEAEQGESESPRDENWATTSSGSTHTSDYTWTEESDDRSNRKDSISSDSDDEDAGEGDRQELTKDQLSRVKQMLMSHSRCFAQTLSDVGRTDIIEHHIRLKSDARPVYHPGFKRFSQPELQFIEKEVQK